MSNVKEEVEVLLKKLPEDCPIEDVQYHLYVLEKIRREEERVAKEGKLSQDEVDRRLRKWILK